MGLGWVKETGRVELHELHAFHFTFGTVHHRNTVSGRNLRVGGGGINRTRSAGSHECDTAQIGVDLLGLGIQDIRAVALDIRCASGDAYTQMVLCDDLYRKMMFQHLNIRVVTHRFH